MAGPSLFYPAGAAASDATERGNEDSAAQQIFPAGRQYHGAGGAAGMKGQPDRRQAIVEPASAFAGSNNPAMGERARQGAQYSASKAGQGASRLPPGGAAAAQQQMVAAAGTSNARRRSQDNNNAAA